MDNSIGRNKTKNLILVLLVIFLPILQAGVIALFSFQRNKSGLSCPLWNDEAAYYALIKTWITSGAHKAFGNPIGYYGFNGGHAILGTGSAWNPAIIFPYVVFAKMFGLGYHTIWVANLVFLMLASLIFILIVKPDLETKFRFVLIFAVSTPVILYVSTQMSEPLRYALTLILAGMIYELFSVPTKEINPVFKYLIMPLYIICLVQIYIFFVFVVPFYIFGLLKEKKIWIRLLSSIAAMGLVGGGSYYLLHLISSNYNIFKAERLFTAIQNKDIVGAVMAMVSMVKEGLTDLYNLARYGACHGLLTWFVILLITLFVVSLVAVIRTPKECKDLPIYWVSLFSIVVFTGAFVTMYSLDPNTFFRSNAIVALFVLYLFAMTQRRNYFYVALIVFACGLLTVPANLEEYSTSERYLSNEEMNQWDELEKEFGEALKFDADKDPWDSTVVIYTLEPKVLTSIPAGMGINMMLREATIPEEAGYLLFSKEEDNLRSDWLEQSFSEIDKDNHELLATKYAVAFENEEYIIFTKN